MENKGEVAGFHMGATGSIMSQAETFISQGTAGLKVKDSFEIYHQTLLITHRPSSLQTSLPLLKKKKTVATEQGMIWEQILFDDREGSFCFLIPTNPFPLSSLISPTGHQGASWSARGSQVISYFFCLKKTEQWCWAVMSPAKTNTCLLNIITEIP